LKQLVNEREARDSTLYHTPGTNEYEAYQEIEPELKDELEKRTYDSNSRLAQDGDSQGQAGQQS